MTETASNSNSNSSNSNSKEDQLRVKDSIQLHVESKLADVHAMRDMMINKAAAGDANNFAKDSRNLEEACKEFSELRASQLKHLEETLDLGGMGLPSNLLTQKQPIINNQYVDTAAELQWKSVFTFIPDNISTPTSPTGHGSSNNASGSRRGKNNNDNVFSTSSSSSSNNSSSSSSSASSGSRRGGESGSKRSGIGRIFSFSTERKPTHTMWENQVSEAQTLVAPSHKTLSDSDITKLRSVLYTLRNKKVLNGEEEKLMEAIKLALRKSMHSKYDDE